MAEAQVDKPTGPEHHLDTRCLMEPEAYRITHPETNSWEEHLLVSWCESHSWLLTLDGTYPVNTTNPIDQWSFCWVLTWQSNYRGASRCSGLFDPGPTWVRLDRLSLYQDWIKKNAALPTTAVPNLMLRSWCHSKQCHQTSGATAEWDCLWCGCFNIAVATANFNSPTKSDCVMFWNKAKIEYDPHDPDVIA